MKYPDETPLEDVLADIRKATKGPNDAGIPIYVDPVGLVSVEKTPTSPVRMDLEGIPLRRTLRLLLSATEPGLQGPGRSADRQRTLFVRRG